jgi:hypothetical protein
VSRWPAPGEAVVSPALSREQPDAVAGRVVGLIAPAGLASPDEYVAYVGVGPADIVDDSTTVSGFGISHKQDVDLAALDGKNIALTMGVLMGLPLIALVVTCARMAATSQARRTSALRLVGLSGRAARLTLLLEWGALVTVGTVLGLAAFELMSSFSDQLSVGSFAVFTEDLRLSLAAVLTVCLALPTATLILVTRGNERAVRQALQARREPSTRAASPLAIAPLVLGACSLAGVALSRHSAGSKVASNLMVAGVGLTGIGLLTAGRALLRGALASGALPGGPTGLLLARRLRHDLGAAQRLAAGLSLVLFAGVMSLGFQRDATAAAGPADGIQRYELQQDATHDDEVAGVLAHRALTPGVRRVSPIQVSRPAGPVLTPSGATVSGGTTGQALIPVQLLIGTCSALRGIAGAQLAECRDGKPQLLVFDRPGFMPDLSQPLDYPIVSASGPARLRLPTPDASTAAGQRFVDAFGPVNLLVPPDLVPPARTAQSGTWIFATSAASDEVDATLDALRALGGREQVILTNADVAGAYANRLLTSILQLGLLVGALVAAVAFTAATYDAALERRHALTSLRLAGFSRGRVRTIQALEFALPVAILGFVSLALAALAELAYLRRSGLVHSGVLHDTLREAVVYAVIVAVAGATGWVTAPTHVRAADIRRE